jgi:hypothetical protein
MSEGLGIDQTKIYWNINIDTPNSQVEFQVHTYASLLVVGTMLSQNVIGKSDQLIVYAFRLLNKT